MKILVVSQYFPPEPGAPANRVLSFVEAMTRRGHEVTVVCEFPNYPSGRLSPEDKWRLYRVEDTRSHKVIRTFVLAFPEKNNIKRMLYYLSFAFSSFWTILFSKRHEVVFASSPPIFHAFSSMLAAKFKRSKFVLDIRDLWPDSALEVEAISNSRLLKWGSFLERKIYDNARAIFAVSRGMRDKIIERGGKGKTHTAYNGSVESILNWSGDNDKFREKSGWTGKTVILYAGILGLGQDIPALLPEISKLKPGEEEFLFIGNGPDKTIIEEYVDEYRLENVQVLDAVSRSEIIPYLHCADILIVVLRENDFFKSAIPSKFFDYMAAGKPVISNAGGELREIMEKNKTGIYFSLAEPGSFGAAIEALSHDPNKRRQMGNNGRQLVSDRFLRSKLADYVVKQIEDQLGW